MCQDLLKLFAQGDKPIDLVVDGREMIADERVNLPARNLRLVLQGKQGADCADLKAEFAGMAYKSKAANIALAISADCFPTATAQAGARFARKTVWLAP